MKLFQRWRKADPINTVTPEVCAKNSVDNIQNEIMHNCDEADKLKIAHAMKGCKAEDEVFHDAMEKLDEEKDALSRLHDKAIVDVVNTFPLNHPCTTKYISEYTGLGRYTVEHCILRKHHQEADHELLNRKRLSMMEKQLFEEEDSTYGEIVKVNVISDTEAEIEAECGTYRNEIAMPNWRFVKSKYDDTRYVERFVDEQTEVKG